MTIHNFWLKQSKLIDWHKKPTIAFKKKITILLNGIQTEK